MMDTKPLEVGDFTLGITDFYIDGTPNEAQEMDNVFFTPNRKLITRWGSTLYQEEQMPLGSFRVNKLLFYKDNDLIAFQQRRGYIVSGGSWTEIQGPGGDPIFPTGDTNSHIFHDEWQDHYFLTNSSYSSPQKLYRDSGGLYQIRNAGLPEIPAGLSITNPPGAGSTYLYAVVFKYEYTVGDVTYLDRGPVNYYSTPVTGGTITGGNGANITLPTVLPLVENWDDTNFEVEIYRTVDAGDVYYLVATVAFGTSAYLDENTDAVIQANEQLYTTGGVFSNGTPPKAKFVHVVNNVGYYGNILENSETKSSLLLQSIPGDPDSVPRDFFTEMEEPITGVSSIFDRPIVFCSRYVYRIDNTIDLLGVGAMLPRRIDDNAGCVSQNSIVQTHKGLFWAGTNGFYWTDGFKVIKVSNHLPKTYATLVENSTKAERIYGTYDIPNERVIWSVSKEEGSNEPDICFVLDLKFPRPEMAGAFTTMSGGDSFRPTSLLFKNNTIYRGDTRGYVFQHKQNIFTDPRVDTSVSPTLWEELTIIHSYKSCFLDFGTKFYRKFVPRILVSAGNTTNLSLAIASSNDNNRVFGNLKPIRYTNRITWGATFPLWGDSSAKWNIQGLIEEWRRFPAGGLRCNYKQVQFTNADVQIVTSTLLGTATVNPTTKTATLGGSFQWPDTLIDYTISFEDDGYDTEFPITARTLTTLTFEDSSSEAPLAGVYNWIIKGKPKGEVLELNGYVLHWAYISKSHTPFSASSLGSNPA